MQIRKIVMLTGIVLAVPSGMVWAQENVQKQIPALKSDTRIQVKSGYASNYQREEGIEKSFDGDEKTLYHSSWGNTRFPVTLEYKLEKAERWLPAFISLVWTGLTGVSGLLNYGCPPGVLRNL